MKLLTLCDRGEACACSAIMADDPLWDQFAVLLPATT